MNKKTIQKIIAAAEAIGWNTKIDGNEFTFSKFSPAGQDFNVEVRAGNSEELIKEVYERYENFDCSEETYLWLDNTGHGTNGAPYDMKDLYEDMETCEAMMLDLHKALESKFAS